MIKSEKGSAGTAWIIVIVVVIALLVWWLASSPAEAPVLEEETLSSQIEDEATAGIALELEGLSSADLEVEFSEIEADLNQL